MTSHTCCMGGTEWLFKVVLLSNRVRSSRPSLWNYASPVSTVVCVFEPLWPSHIFGTGGSTKDVKVAALLLVVSIRHPLYNWLSYARNYEGAINIANVLQPNQHTNVDSTGSYTATNRLNHCPNNYNYHRGGLREVLHAQLED